MEWTWPRWRAPSTMLPSSIREQGTPRFLELHTYRFRAHSMYDPDKYRAKEEVAEWKKRDPVELLATRLVAAGQLDAASREACDGRVRETIEQAVREAEEGALEPESELLRDVYARPIP